MSDFPQKASDKKSLQLAMSLSLGVGILMFIMKISAYWLTGSTAILSDAAESVVHVAAVIFAAYSLRLSFKPPDDTHPYGHEKINFFSAGFEGAMITFAAIYIIYEAISEWLAGLHLENLGIGAGITVAAFVINGILGAYLVWIGRKKKSLILEANGKHVLTDSWTSLGVLIGLGLTLTTGWLPWDPICAILVAGNILFSGIGLMRKSVGGLMDEAEPEVGEKLEGILTQQAREKQIHFHELKYRNLGNSYWVEVHLLFPGDMPIQQAHQIATAIEDEIRTAFEMPAYITTHLESLEDHQDVHLHDRHEI